MDPCCASETSEATIRQAAALVRALDEGGHQSLISDNWFCGRDQHTSLTMCLA